MSDLPSPDREPDRAPSDRDAWRQERRRLRAERRRSRWEQRGSYGWLVGVVLILLGLVFLVSNLTGVSLGNWWALFILIPAVGAFARAWKAYREEGHFSGAMRGGLVGGVVLLLVTFVLFFNLDWGRIWPLFLVIGGISVLLSSLLG
jgi:hypothetical protein